MKKILSFVALLLAGFLLVACTGDKVGKPTPRGKEIEYSEEVIYEELGNVLENIEETEGVYKLHLVATIKNLEENEEVKVELTAHFDTEGENLWLELEADGKINDEKLKFKVSVYTDLEDLYLEIKYDEHEDMPPIKQGKFVIGFEALGLDLIDGLLPIPDVEDILGEFDLEDFDFSEIDLEELDLSELFEMLEELTESGAVKFYQSSKHFTVEVDLTKLLEEEEEIKRAEMIIIFEEGVLQSFFVGFEGGDEEMSIKAELLISVIPKAPKAPKASDYERIEDIMELIDFDFDFPFQ